jgi:hypothetical protein
MVLDAWCGGFVDKALGLMDEWCFMRVESTDGEEGRGFDDRKFREAESSVFLMFHQNMAG